MESVALRDFGSVHTRRTLALVRRHLEQALAQLPAQSSLLEHETFASRMTRHPLLLCEALSAHHTPLRLREAGLLGASDAPEDAAVSG
jgi:HEAT repeat protein